MQNYKTVEEKAAEWKLSPRHVQYLCRNGKVKGAVKHAKVWFISEDAPSPAKKTKAGSGDFDFVGTKGRIFESAVELFVLNGFDNVSLRDIADKVGIQQSTIYNHFKSKQEILNVIYNFYCHHYLKDRPDLEDMEVKLPSASFMDIIDNIRYEFGEDYRQKMSDITKIIFQRIGIDDRAKEIAKSLMLDEGIRYVEAVFNKAVETRRFLPFDTHAMAVFINSVRIFTFYNWIINPSPDNMIRLRKDEQDLYEYSAKCIENLNLFEHLI